MQGRDSTGSLTFADEMLSFPTRLIAATSDSVVFDLLRPLDGPDSMKMRFAGRPGGDSLRGEVFVRLRNGTMGRRTIDGTRVGSIPVFERSRCPFEVPDVQRVECGWLTVPELRSKPLGRSVRLNVVVVRAGAPTALPPTVFISGGPGQAGAPTRNSPNLVTRARDLIYYDQRATGRSQPDLCPEFEDSITAHRSRITRQTRADVETPFIRQCVESLRALGIDPEAYNTSTSAHDLADLRRALGYERWILRGGSYGTRLAQEAMRVDPSGVHAAILIGPAPPGRSEEVVEGRLSTQRTFARLFEACQADAGCHAAFPDPQADFFALFDELNRVPIMSPTANGRDTVEFHGDRLVTALQRLFDGNNGFARIPFLLHELRRGDGLRAARELAPNVNPGAGVSAAVNRLVSCYESPGLRQATIDSANTVPLPPFRVKLDRGTCALWRARFATDAEHAPLTSDIPTLIMTGEYDWRTPIQDARIIAQTLKRVFVYEIPDVGHSGMTPCGFEILRQFTDDPTREPDASCLTRGPKLTFPARWPEAARPGTVP